MSLLGAKTKRMLAKAWSILTALRSQRVGGGPDSLSVPKRPLSDLAYDFGKEMVHRVRARK